MKPITQTLRMTAAVCLMLVAGAAAGGDDRGDDGGNDLARLKGTWVRVLDGKAAIFHFNGEKFAEILEFAEGTSTTSGAVTIDPTRNPKHMDWKLAEGTGRGEKLKGTTARTIYQIDGDTFRFCASKDNVRPDKFPDREGVGEYLYLVFKRVK